MKTTNISNVQKQSQHDSFRDCIPKTMVCKLGKEPITEKITKITLTTEQTMQRY